ncbi:putative uncharacterized protein [Bacteroides sp. CAG:661]|nr:putative uncharacterized protein [Bacteroides sp. CAG:661]
MRTAAELDGRAELDDADVVAVLFAEEGDGTQFLGFLDGDVTVFLQRYVGTDLGVDQAFYLAQLFVGHLLEVREVEAQRVRRNQRTLLLHVVAQHGAQGLVQQVRTRVVGGAGGALVGVYAGHHRCVEVFGQLLGDMDGQVVLLLGVDDVDGLELTDQDARVAYLTAAFGVERRLVQHNLVERLALLLYLAVAQDTGFVFRIVVTYKFGGTFLQCNPVACFYGSGVAGALLLLLHLGVELLEISRHAVLAQDQFGQVEREAESVVQREGILSADFGLAGSLGVGHGLLQQTDTRFERAQEGFFFLLDDFDNQFLLGLQFGIGFSHVLYQHGDELVHEGLLLSEERIAVADSAAQDAADDVAGLGVAGQLSVGDGEGDGADVVGHDTHGNVRFLIGSVSLSGHVAYHLQDGLEDVGVVVGRFPLQSTHQSFESHAGVDDSGRKRFEAAVGLAVVLHEHEVPDFDDLRVVLVHQFASGHLGFLFFRARVDVDLRAGAAGTRIAHFPEIVMLVAVQDVVFRQELFPVGGGFVVAFEAFFGTSLEDGGIQVLRVDFQHVHQVFPGPGNGFLLEVVAERPVAQHLEHGVVVGVVADLLQVVVLAADAKALL